MYILQSKNMRTTDHLDQAQTQSMMKILPIKPPHDLQRRNQNRLQLNHLISQATTGGVDQITSRYMKPKIEANAILNWSAKTTSSEFVG